MFLSVAGLCVAQVLQGLMMCSCVFMMFGLMGVHVGVSCYEFLGYWLFCVVFLLCSCIYCIFAEAHCNPLLVKVLFN